MDIRKIIAVLTAGVSAALSAVSCSSDKRSEITASVPIIEEPSTEPETTTEEIIPDATYPDFPVTYPEIEKQATGSVYEAELARLSEVSFRHRILADSAEQAMLRDLAAMVTSPPRLISKCRAISTMIFHSA